MTRMALALALLASLLTGVAASGCSGDPTASADRESPAGPAPDRASHFRFFSPASFWNTPVPAAASTDPSSAALVDTLADQAFHEAQTGEGPFITTSPYSVPIYRVPSDQPTVRVQLVGHPADASLRAAWRAVPLPPDAQPATGTDGHLIVWQPSTDRLWEFFRLVRTSAGWQASWGGAMRNASEAPGVYNRRVWPGSQPWWGASASSLSIAGGLITFEDLEHGEIDHALAISLPEVRAGVYASPARRTDGRVPDPRLLPEGAHLQLNPHLDLAALRMPRLTRMIARAAQRYGIFVRDTAGDVTFYAQDPTPTGTEPYGGAGGYFGGATPIELLARFPWHHLRVLKMRLHPARSR
jgi:hypothetical protein